MNIRLSDPLRLPCGAVLSNRLAKAAMTEGLADAQLRATERHERLYRLWSEGGAALSLTGNVIIDRYVLERPGNVAIDLANGGGDAEARTRLRRWAAAGTVAGNHLWMQLSHAGRQSPRYVTGRPVGPSAVQLEIMGNYARPRALSETEILDFIRRFGRVAALARDCGFTGVQIHSAHGYLLSSFLSPHTNRRSDDWGGALKNRARLLLETVKTVRQSVGRDFPVAVKLNSDDFRKGGFAHAECLQVVQWLNDAQIDLLEISGGTYEQPRLLGHEGRAVDASIPLRESTQKREAYFLDYASAIRKLAKIPLMVTGGFRTRAGMEAALSSGDCDMIGLGRPLCTHPGLPRQLLSGVTATAPQYEKTLMLSRRRWLSPASPVFPIKVLNVLGAQGWYYQQLFQLADHGRPDLKLGVLSAFFRYLWDEYATARRMHRARKAA